MKLYHFTCREHLEAIKRDGVILTTESNIGSPLPRLKPFGEHVGPDVVWLTDCPNLDRGDHGLSGSAADKSAVRITVEIDDAMPWAKFAAH